MTNLLNLNWGLRDIGHIVTEYTPSWMADGLNRRKRGQLGFRLMTAHQSGADHHGLCDQIATFKQATGMSKFAAPRAHEEDRTKTHNILSQVAYIGPTLAAGLTMTAFLNLAGLVTQVADTIRLDSGQAFFMRP